MSYTLRTPLEGLSPFQRLLWPLIFAQLIALKAWMRAQFGPGVPYWIRISHLGRVSLRHMPSDFTQSWAAPGAYLPAGFAYASGFVRSALSRVLMARAAARAPRPAPEIRIRTNEMGQAAACPDTS